jgi:hypothetical protein
MTKKYYSRPYLDIKKGTVPNSEYKSGKAVALLFALDFLTHQAEGQCVKILDQMEKYLHKEIKKLGVEITVSTNEFNIAELRDLEIRLNLNRNKPMNEGTR